MTQETGARREMVRLSAMHHLDMENVAELWKFLEKKNYGTKGWDRLCGLLACGFLRNFWEDRRYLKDSSRLKCALGFAEGHIELEELQKSFAPQRVYGTRRQWANAWLEWSGIDEGCNRRMKWNGAGAGCKRQMLFEIFGGGDTEQEEIEALWRIPGVFDFAEAVYGTNALWSLQPLLTILQEEGYDNFAVLAHCRQERHTHGCWLVDRILGKS